jgi:hypothetical protein
MSLLTTPAALERAAQVLAVPDRSPERTLKALELAASRGGLAEWEARAIAFGPEGQTQTESTAGTPAADPVGFARLQAAMSFDKRNSSDYSDPEEAIDFGLDNLNDTLTEYKVTDPYVREQAVEAYKNEIARLKGEVGTVPVDQAPAKVGRLNEFLARFKTI